MTLNLLMLHPFFKKTILSIKKNCRPVRVLPGVSKVYEKLMQRQINDYIANHLSPYLCGCRKVYNTQEALVSLIEKWKKILDDKGFGGAVLMDLSKAFDTLNHELLIAKLHVYGFNPIQNGGGWQKGLLYQFFLFNFYKRRILPPKLFDL